MIDAIRKLRSTCTELLATVKQAMGMALEIDRRLVILYYVTAAVGALAPLGATYFLKVIIDQIKIDVLNVTDLMTIALGVYLCMILLDIVIYWGLNVAYFDYLLRNRMQAGLTYRYSEKMASLDLQHLENAETQTLIAKVDETYQWQIPDFLRMWGYIFTNITGIVAATLLLLPFGWWLPAILIVLSVPRMYFKLSHGNFTWAMFGNGAPQVKKLWYMAGLLSYRDSILETRIFRSQGAILKRMKQLHDSLYLLNKKPLDKYRWVLIFVPFVEIAIIFFLVYPMMSQVLGGALTLGSFTFIVVTIGQLRAQTSLFSANVGDLYQHGLFVRPFFELMALPRLIKEVANPRIFTIDQSPKIEFKNVSFTYPAGNRVLKDVSFIIQPGESVALVGVNGAGKTTIIKLLCRFYDVSSGEIRINGTNIKELQLDNWYSHMATLFQDFVKYNFSVRDNIMLGHPDIEDEERMIQAAKQAGAHSFIMKLPNQYNQVLGHHYDQGIDLSGGQWQKLAVARAMYQKAPFLIMDEPTSAIDAASEAEIFTHLEKIYVKKTLLLVSHRFSTVRTADKIIVLEDGGITEQGSHDELLALQGTYAELFNQQAAGYR